MRMRSAMNSEPECGAAVQVRLTGRVFGLLENWRKSQDKILPRSQAMRLLLEKGLAADPPTAQAGGGTPMAKLMAAWQDASREQQAEFLDVCDYEIACVRHRMNDERIAIAADEQMSMTK